MVELAHHAAAQTAFGHAASGQPITSDAFRRRERWLVDITAELPNGHKIAIEYDGAYWHHGLGKVRWSPLWRVVMV